MIRIKVCGITSIEDGLAACEAGADAVGFVLAPEAVRRNRYVPPERLAELTAALPPYVVRVAVMVNPTAVEVAEVLKWVDRVQLHGEESPAFCAQFGSRVYKAVRLASDGDVKEALAYPGECLLADAAAGSGRGGTGVTGRWDLAARLASRKRWLVLAGGLNPDNVVDAIRATRPWAVDVSSGVERAPGKKDYDKLYRFIEAVRSVERAG
ncbi:MAG: phosphoribosylanthranilate isomerase [Candidatus Hydrogenedentes bacterium]|nr:phosphoribosylanthranilate isomerase [Candidatus Hydrogenedentota bacterium]